MAETTEESAPGTHPAPWKWKEELGDEDDLPRLLDADGKVVCHFGNSRQYYPDEGEPPETVAAALIAAAPEMEALLRKLEWLCLDRDYPEPRCPECQEERDAEPQRHSPDCALGNLLARIETARKT